MTRIAPASGIIGLLALLGSSEGLADIQEVQQTVPAAVQRLLQCRNLPSSEQRLACFDRETATMASDISRRDLVVVDRGQLASTRRTLFGLQLPRLDVLGNDNRDEVKQIESTVRTVGLNREGSSLFTLADGSRWSQTDSTVLEVQPRRGEKAAVRRGALGSYVLVVAGQAPVKVKRVQ